MGPGPIMIRPAVLHQFPLPEQTHHNQPQQPMNGTAENLDFYSVDYSFVYKTLKML